MHVFWELPFGFSVVAGTCRLTCIYDDQLFLSSSWLNRRKSGFTVLKLLWQHCGTDVIGLIHYQHQVLYINVTVWCECCDGYSFGSRELLKLAQIISYGKLSFCCRIIYIKHSQHLDRRHMAAINWLAMLEANAKVSRRGRLSSGCCLGYELRWVKEPCIRWGSRYPMWRGNFEGGRGGPLWSIGTLCGELCKNGWTHHDAVRVVGWDAPKESCVRWGSRSPDVKGQLLEERTCRIMPNDTLLWTVQK